MADARKIKSDEKLSSEWPVVDKLVSKLGIKYAQSMGLSLREYVQLSGLHIPDYPKNMDIGEDLETAFDPWDIYPWKKEEEGKEIIYKNVATGEVMLHAPTPMFERKLQALSQLTPRGDYNRNISEEKYVWRESPSDRRRRRRYEQRLKKTIEEEKKRRTNAPNEREQVENVLNDLINEIDGDIYSQEITKSHLIRKKEREYYHPSTLGFPMQKLAKSTDSPNLVTDLKYEGLKVLSNGELVLTRSGTHAMLRENGNEKFYGIDNTKTSKDQDEVLLKYRFKITLACSAPEYYEEILETEKNDSSGETQKSRLDKTKMTMFSDQLRSEVSQLADISAKGVIIEEIVKDSLECETCNNHRSGTQGFQDLGMTMNKAMKNASKNIKKGFHTEAIKRSIHIFSKRYSNNKKFKMIRSDHCRTTITFLLLNGKEETPTHLVRNLEQDCSTFSLMSLVTSWSQVDNIGTNKIFEKWETYWSHIIHPSFFGYKIKKTCYKGDVNDSSMKPSNMGRTKNNITISGTQFKRHNQTKEKRKKIDNSIYNDSIQPYLNKDKRNKDGIGIGRPIRLSIKKFSQTLKPDRLFRQKKKEIPKAEKDLYLFLQTLITTKVKGVEQPESQATLMRLQKTIQNNLESFTEKKLQELFQVLQEKIYTIIPNERASKDNDVSIDNSILILTSFLEDQVTDSILFLPIITVNFIQVAYMNHPVKNNGRINQKEFVLFFSCLAKVLSKLDISCSKEHPKNKNNSIESARFKKTEDNEYIKTNFHDVSKIGKPIPDKNLAAYLEMVKACEEHCPMLSRLIYKGILKKEGINSFLCLVFDPSSKLNHVLRILPCNKEADLETSYQEMCILRERDHDALVNIFHVESVFAKSPCIHGEVKHECRILIIIMEWCSGGQLLKNDSTKRFGDSFKSETVIKWTTQLLKGMYHLHSLDILHRNINPGNFYLDDKNKIKLGGYMCCRYATSLGHPKTFGSFDVGNAVFLAPEIKNDVGDITTKTDIWAFGCSLFFMLTGSLPDLERFSIEKEIKKVPLHFDKRFNAILASALRLNPIDRGSAESLLTILE